MMEAAIPSLEEAYRGKTVLVTGLTGFKGAWLGTWLTDLGAKVIGLSDGASTEPGLFKISKLGGLTEDRRLDIRDRAAVEALFQETRPEVVFHLAAQPIVRIALADPFETFSINVLGMAAVLEAARRTPSIRAVVAVTSDKVYQNTPGDRTFHENDRLGGHEPYGASKAAAEIVAEVYRHPGFHRGAGSSNQPALATARAGNVIGGGDWAADRLIPDVVRALAAKRDVVLRQPNSIRPWQHVLEPLSGYMALGAALFGGQKNVPAAVNFGPKGGDEPAAIEVVRMFLAAWGPIETRIVVERDLSGAEAQTLRVDSGLAERTLGWVAAWQTPRAIEETARWYRAWADAEQDLADLMREQIANYTRDARAAGAAWAGGKISS
jgi:CDP-glucose 4,6-dehydratase